MTLGVRQPLGYSQIREELPTHIFKLIPMPPLKRLEPISVDPGAKAELALLDLDLLFLAFSRLASSTACLG